MGENSRYEEYERLNQSYVHGTRSKLEQKSAMFFGARLKPFAPLVSEYNKLRWIDLG